MAGLVGVARRAPSASAAYARGAAALRGTGARRAEYRDPDDHWAIGLATLGILEHPEAQRRGGTSIVLFRGDLSNEAALRAELGGDHGDAAAIVAAVYERFGTGGISRLDGAFALAIVDPRERQLHLATDAFGSYPVYWRADEHGLAFASEVAALLRMANERPALSLSAVADYLTMGFVLGSKTLASGAALLDPGTVLTYDWSTGAASKTKYFEPAELFRGPRLDRPAYVDAVRAAFERGVARCLAGPHRFGLSLSGGLDSRAVLSAVNGYAPRLVTYTLGVPGCADEVIANRLSRLAGTDHRFFALDDQYLRDFLPNQARMVSMTDGLYLSHGLTEMLAIEFLKGTGIEVLLRGHGGELAKTRLAWPLHTDDHVYRLSSTPALIDYLSGRANYISAGLALDSLFLPDAAAISGRGAADSLGTLLSGIELSPAELCGYVYLREHHRRFTIPSLELFRSIMEVRLPFMDREFLSVLLSGRPEWRDDTSVHQSITRAGSPALLKVRNSNTGAPGDAGPLVERILDKVNTLLKRLNAPGYRHYHSFEAWMRTRLLETVEQQLLSADARSAMYLRPDVLERIIRDTRSGTRDRAYLLQILLIVELWLRENDVTRVAA
jgi:asparagine synthase (glutamine-hydrolysing)